MSTAVANKARRAKRVKTKRGAERVGVTGGGLEMALLSARALRWTARGRARKCFLRLHGARGDWRWRLIARTLIHCMKGHVGLAAMCGSSRDETVY